MKILPFGAVVAVLALSGCASVSVKNIERHAQAAQPPAVIYLQDYDTRGGNWKITSRSRTPEQFKGEVAELLSKNLAADLEGFLHVPVHRVGSRKDLPPNGWLVTGRFIRVSEGNPAGRILFGLGIGSSKVETETIVFDGRSRGAILQFATTGGSNAYPGALISSGPASSVISGVSQAMRGVNDDTKRTARMVTASMAEFEAEKGWIKPSSLKPKKPGQFQILQPQTASGKLF